MKELKKLYNNMSFNTKLQKVMHFDIFILDRLSLINLALNKDGSWGIGKPPPTDLKLTFLELAGPN